MKQSTIRIIDVETRHERHPDTFHVLDRSEREAVDTGDLVKLVFEYSGGSEVGGERMWVQVVETADTPTGKVFVGRLNNIPLFLPMKLGDRVSFAPSHVLDIHPDVAA